MRARIPIANKHPTHVVDTDRLRRAVRSVLEIEGMEEVTLSVAIVDDATICELNRKYLRHNRPTDVLSFVIDETLTTLDGEIVVNADRAAVLASRFGWTADDELLLYAVHGTLHLVGYDDKNAERRQLMRNRERFYLGLFGLTPQYRYRRLKAAKKSRPARRGARRST